jgi:myo-inositol-1(or 4)-monophosphatase
MVKELKRGQLLDLAVDAAKEARAVLKKNFLIDAGVESSEAKDIKTKADVSAQEVIVSHLKPTGIPIIAEESGGEVDKRVEGLKGLKVDGGEEVERFKGLKVDGNDRSTVQPINDSTGHPEDARWFVDPLDGTLNFTRGFPMAAVSIALWEGMEPSLGVIADVFTGEIFSGEVGVGATLGDRPLRVSSTSDPAQAVIATGFPSGRSYDSDSLLEFVQKVQRYKKVRMLGSAALMLAQVAAGRFDIYEEEDIYLWDVAAGLALVKAARGEFSMKPGSGPFKYHVRASNGRLRVGS